MILLKRRRVFLSLACFLSLSPSVSLSPLIHLRKEVCQGENIQNGCSLIIPIEAITEPWGLADTLLGSSPIMLTLPPPAQGQLRSSTASKTIIVLNVLEISCHLGYCVSASPCRILHLLRGRAHFSLSSRTIQTLMSTAGLSRVDGYSVSPVRGLGLQGQETWDQPSFSVSQAQPPGSSLLLNMSASRHTPEAPYNRASLQCYPTPCCKQALLKSLVAQMVKNLPAMQETWVRSLGWEDPLEEGMAPHSSILAWRIPMDRGAWRAAVHGVRESQTRLRD